MKRYQENPFYIRWLIWLHFMPFAYLRGVYWYISQLWVDNIDGDDSENLHDCISISIGSTQVHDMHWVYSGEECMRMSRRK